MPPLIRPLCKRSPSKPHQCPNKKIKVNWVLVHLGVQGWILDQSSGKESLLRRHWGTCPSAQSHDCSGSEGCGSIADVGQLILTDDFVSLGRNMSCWSLLIWPGHSVILCLCASVQMGANGFACWLPCPLWAFPNLEGTFKEHLDVVLRDTV